MIENIKTGSAAETPWVFETAALTDLTKSAKQPKPRKQTSEAENAKVSVLKSAADRVMDLLFPSALYCICCGNLIDETRTYHLCDHCLSHIRWDGSDVRSIRGLKTLSCTRYGLYERSLVFALKYNGRKYIARELAEMMRDRLILAEAEFDVIVPVPMFSEKERSLVFALKYNGRKYIARELAEMMRDRLILAEAEFDVIVPVPMFSEKERSRGFNHAALMGKYLGTLTGKPCFAHGLLRTSDTLPMRGLGPSERRSNVKDKFACNEKYVTMLKGKRVLLLDHGLLRTSDTLPMRGLGPSERRSNVKDKFACNEKYVTMLKGKRVLLLDDFYTTGSTAGECFRALKTAEPKDVLFLAFAARY